MISLTIFANGTGIFMAHQERMCIGISREDAPLWRAAFQHPSTPPQVAELDFGVYYPFAGYVADRLARLQSELRGRSVRSAAEEARTTRRPILYRGYLITYDYPPVPTRAWDWGYAPEDYDGPEDRRAIGSAASVEEAMAAIDEAWEEGQA